jgi:hypothetical protein
MVAGWLKDMAFAGHDGWTLVLVLHLATTLLMVGLIWLVQIVYYPLFARVGDSSFAAYHSATPTGLPSSWRPLCYWNWPPDCYYG